MYCRNISIKFSSCFTSSFSVFENLFFLLFSPHFFFLQFPNHVRLRSMIHQIGSCALFQPLNKYVLQFLDGISIAIWARSWRGIRVTMHACFRILYCLRMENSTYLIELMWINQSKNCSEFLRSTRMREGAINKTLYIHLIRRLRVLGKWSESVWNKHEANSPHT